MSYLLIHFGGSGEVSADPTLPSGDWALLPAQWQRLRLNSTKQKEEWESTLMLSRWALLKVQDIVNLLRLYELHSPCSTTSLGT